MLSEGTTIISEDSNFNTQLVNKEIHVLNGIHQFDENGGTIIIFEDSKTASNNHSTHKQTLTYLEKKIKIQRPDQKKTYEYQKIKDFNDDQIRTIPFLPNNIFRNKYGSNECLIINLLNYKVSLIAITSELCYNKILIIDLQQQKYNSENLLLSFLKSDSFFTRPPPYKAGPILVFI